MNSISTLTVRIPCAYFAYWWHDLQKLQILHMICICFNSFCMFFILESYNWTCSILVRPAAYFLHIFCIFCKLFCIFFIFFCIFFAFFLHIFCMSRAWVFLFWHEFSSGMSFFIMLVAIVGKEQNGTSWGVNPSCLCTQYAIYANYAKMQFMFNVPEITRVTALVTAVGAVTLMTKQLSCWGGSQKMQKIQEILHMVLVERSLLLSLEII